MKSRRYKLSGPSVQKHVWEQEGLLKFKNFYFEWIEMQGQI